MSSSKLPPIIKSLHNDIGHIIILLFLKHLVQGDENHNPYLVLHHITMNKQLKLVVKCKNFITTKSNILNSPHCSLTCFHYFLMHELCHHLVGVVTLMFFCWFLAMPKIHIKASTAHILSWDVLVATNARLKQIAQPSLPSFLPSHLQLGQ